MTNHVKRGQIIDYAEKITQLKDMGRKELNFVNVAANGACMIDHPIMMELFPRNREYIVLLLKNHF